MFTTSAPRITVRFVALLTAVSLVLSAFPAAFFVANAQEVPPEVPATDTPAEEVTDPVQDTEVPPAEETTNELPEEPVEEVAKVAASIVIDEPSEDSATIIVTKIICDDESDLPNWGGNTENPDITADTAEDWVEAHEGCFFAKGWQFQWAPLSSETSNPGDTLVGEAGAPWTTFSYSTTIPESAFAQGVWVREVLQDDYIPFTYNPGKVNTNDVSAEIYCNADVLNYDNFDYVGGLEDDATYYCVAWNVEKEPTATIIADKIVCEDESMLPNWGSNAENPDITADTAEDWVAEHEGCEFVKGWQFQWAPLSSETSNPGDALVGEAGAPWTTFSYSTEVPESAFAQGIWVREVLKDGYIPFTYNPGKVNNNPVSAELYCHQDVLNYDNFDYVGGLEDDATYYCVAWNVAEEVEPTETITACKLDENKNPVAGWEMAVTNYEGEGDDYYELVTGEDGCVSIEVNPEFGPWLVMEEVQEGWSQVEALATNGEVYSYEEDDYSFCVFFDYRAEARVLDSSESQGDMDPSYTCTFINDGPDEIEEPEKPRKNGSSGTRTKRAPQGQVLGAATQCGLWLEDYMQKATENDTYQVLKLQVFLTLQGFATPLTGIFDATTEANVKLFQTKYADTVIKPWFEKGIVPHNRPTGFVYKTTRWQINDIMCPGIEAYPSFDGENLSTNVLISR